MINEKPRLNIRVLGSAEIQVSGTALYLNHLKARALLFYLAATGQPHTRDFLATLLWSESGSANALHSLRSSLYRLRRSLRANRVEEVIISDGEQLCLEADAYQCDAITFRHLLADGSEAALEQAVALNRGQFLQGFNLPDAPIFDEWARLEETRLSQACFESLARLASMAESRQALSTAIGYIQQMIRIDPLAEIAQQRLMKLYLKQGNANLAVRQYRQFEELLQQELNLTPSSETRSLLFDALHWQHSPVAFTNLSVFTPSHKTFILPFIGRDQFLRQLSAISQEVRGGLGTTVLLQGDAGIGKSRLLGELISQLIAGSPLWNVLQGACSPFDDLLSHGPFLEALQYGVEDPKELWDDSDSSVPDARGRFSWRILQVIRSLSHINPLVFVIEDLQWANSSTLNLFGFLSMHLHQLPVLLVGTVQHAEAIPALQRLISLGRRRGELRLFSLDPLTLADVSTLLQTSGIDLDSVVIAAKWLHEKSAGSPFLLTEILAQLRAESILRLVGDNWQLDTIRWLQWRTTFLLPETTHDLVSWRLTNLPFEAQYLLNVLAVAGQPLQAAVLRVFPGIQGDTFLDLVEDLEKRGLIIEATESTLALPHHLLRETLLHHMSDLRRRKIHRLLAQVLEAFMTTERAACLPQIALHAVAGEDIDRARQYGLQMLAELPQEYTGAETLDFVRHLHELLAPGGFPDEMIRLTRTLGTLHQSLGHLDAAMHWHQENLDWAKKFHNPDAQAEAHFEMGELALMINNYKEAARTAQDGLSILKAEKPISPSSSLGRQTLIGRGYRLLGAALAMEGSDLTAAENHLQEAVSAHRQSGNPGDLCAALFELGNIAAQRGKLQRALNFYAEAAKIAKNGHIHYYFALALNNFAYHCLLLGRIGEAQKSAAQGLKTAEAYDLITALQHLFSTQGEIHLYLAEWVQAEDSFRHGLAIADDLGNLERQAGCRGGMALAARGRGDLESGVQLIKEALALIDGQGYWHLHARLQLWLAETLYEQAQFSDAAMILKAVMEIVSPHRRNLLLIQAERLHAQLLAEEGDWTAAETIFANTLAQVSELGLELEIARLQLAWGEAALQYTLIQEKGHTLITNARAILAAHDARADLASLRTF